MTVISARADNLALISNRDAILDDIAADLRNAVNVITCLRDLWGWATAEACSAIEIGIRKFYERVQDISGASVVESDKIYIEFHWYCTDHGIKCSRGTPAVLAMQVCSTDEIYSKGDFSNKREFAAKEIHDEHGFIPFSGSILGSVGNRALNADPEPLRWGLNRLRARTLQAIRVGYSDIDRHVFESAGVISKADHSCSHLNEVKGAAC